MFGNVIEITHQPNESLRFQRLFMMMDFVLSQKGGGKESFQIDGGEPINNERERVIIGNKNKKNTKILKFYNFIICKYVYFNTINTIPDDPGNGWDFGLDAGFYTNVATMEPFPKNHLIN